MTEEKVTTTLIREKKKKGEKITVLTAYDYLTAQILDRAGIDIILVGDSLGMVVLGYETTLPVTMEEMLHHTKAVVRGAKRAFVVADMPFLSYQVSIEEAIRNAGRFLKEAGAHGVKLEGGEEVADLTGKLTSLGIPVMGHLGLTPQAIHQLGGYKLQAKESDVARKLISDARLLAEAGAFSLVLECIPAQVAAEVTATVNIPTIGIGAGAACDGQVLVINDMLGMFERFTPRFVKRYAHIADLMREAVERYIKEVREGTFPDKEHTLG